MIIMTMMIKNTFIIIGLNNPVMYSQLFAFLGKVQESYEEFLRSVVILAVKGVNTREEIPFDLTCIIVTRY